VPHPDTQRQQKQHFDIVTTVKPERMQPHRLAQGAEEFTKQKTKEIGVRKVLGSSVSGIVLFLSKRFLRWVILANIIAWPLGYFAMHKWLENFAFRTSMNLSLFLLAMFLSIAFAAFPVMGQAIKAAFSNPIEALKYE